MKFHLRPKLPRQHFELYVLLKSRERRDGNMLELPLVGCMYQVPLGTEQRFGRGTFVKKTSVLLNILDETAPGNDQLWI